MTKKKLRKKEVQDELTTSLFDEKDEPENKELSKKIENVRKCEDAVVIIAEYEKMLKNVRKNIIGIASRQGWTLGKFEEPYIFVDLIKQLVISKSTINL